MFRTMMAAVVVAGLLAGTAGAQPLPTATAEPGDNLRFSDGTVQHVDSHVLYERLVESIGNIGYAYDNVGLIQAAMNAGEYPHQYDNRWINIYGYIHNISIFDGVTYIIFGSNEYGNYSILAGMFPLQICKPDKQNVIKSCSIDYWSYRVHTDPILRAKRQYLICHGDGFDGHEFMMSNCIVMATENK
jgi:hypothetical protein